MGMMRIMRMMRTRTVVHASCPAPRAYASIDAITSPRGSKKRASEGFCERLLRPNLIRHALPQGPGVHPGRQPLGHGPAEASAGARRPL